VTLRVLLLDDDVSRAQLVIKSLREAGYEVVAHITGVEDLVSMVRKDEVHKEIPIIIITTEGAQEDRQRALSLGANAYITKPIQAPQVISKVKDLLKIS